MESLKTSYKKEIIKTACSEVNSNTTNAIYLFEFLLQSKIRRSKFFSQMI